MVVKNVVCPVCGGACDDIQVELKDNSITVKNACKMGNGKFQEVVSEHRLRDPMIKKNGTFEKVSWEEALNKAAEILVNAKRPLLFMGSETACEAQEVGLHIGEHLGAVVDSNATVCHGPTVMGIQEAGMASSTCGEAINRSDLNIYWGTNPLASMPRHMSKYGLFPRGYWTKRGRFDRKVITVDPRKTDTAVASDLHIQLKPNSDYELLNALLTIVNGKTPHHSVEKVTGISIAVMQEMVDMMLEARFGSVNVGLGLGSSYGKHRNVEMALNLVKELNHNHGTKFRIGALRGHCNVAGFNQLASYLYGYPFAIDFMRGYPRFNPGETSCVDLLREKDVDAALVVCADLVCHTPADAAKYLCDIPMVCIDISPGPTVSGADVLLPGVIDSFECDGTFYRLDNVPVYFEPFTDSPFEFTKSNEDTLKQLFAKIKELKS